MDFTNNIYYWQLSNASISTNKDTYNLVYMGSPYSMETPTKFSFACTRTVFQLQDPNNTALKYVKVNLYVMDFQVKKKNLNRNNISIEILITIVFIVATIQRICKLKRLHIW